MHKFELLSVCFLLMILAACGGSAEPTLPPAPTAPRATQAAPPMPEPTAVSATAAVTEPSAKAVPTMDAGNQASGGVTDAGFYFLGSPDAPVTLIDYSDFL